MPTPTPQATEIYDGIMSQIDADLLSTSGVKTDEPIPGESPVQFAARKQRYAHSFELYERCLEAYVSHLYDEAQAMRLQKRVANEQQSAGEDRKAQIELLRSISNS